MQNTIACSKNEKRCSVLLFTVVFIAYVVISMTKSAYAAAMVSIIDEGLLTKANSGIINAFFYLFYGVFQLLGLKFLDKVSPIFMVFISLSGSLVSLLGMAFSNSFYQMLLFWSFCGITQFAVWPATVRIISEYLLPEHTDNAKVIISFSYCVGMFMNYLVAAIVLKFSRWQMLFVVSAVIIAVTIVIWCVVTRKLRPIYTKQIEINEKTNKYLLKTNNVLSQSNKHSFMKIAMSSGICLLVIVTFLRSTLDAGLKLWVPTMITETYSVSASFASTLTTVLVLINLLGVFFAKIMYPKRINSPVLAFAVCFLISVPFTLLLLLTGRISVIWVVLFLSVITTMMYAGHQYINVIVPTFFVKYNKAGAMAGVLNAFASFGIVCSNIGFGWIAEHFGWHATIFSWIILAVSAFILCIMAVPMWKSFFENKSL